MNEDQPRVPAGSPDGGQWAGREAVIREYTPIVEKSYPGKAPAMGEVVRRHWDTQAEQRVIDDLRRGGMAGQGGVTVNQSTVTGHVRELMVRKPAFAADMRKLKP